MPRARSGFRTSRPGNTRSWRGRRLAALAAFFRLIELGVHFSAVTFGVAAMSLLSGGEYVKGFGEAQLHGLVGLALRAQLAGLQIGFIPLGIGSAVFAFLLFRSGHVPRLLAAWGVIASLLLAGYAFALVITPATSNFFYLGMVPMLIYEVTLGAWLLFKGVAVRAHAAA